jgi:hypothetical protein
VGCNESLSKLQNSLDEYMSEVLKLWGAPLWEVAVGLLDGARGVCMRGIFILNEIWTEDNIYFGMHFARFTGTGSEHFVAR